MVLCEIQVTERTTTTASRAAEEISQTAANSTPQNIMGGKDGLKTPERETQKTVAPAPPTTKPAEPLIPPAFQEVMYAIPEEKPAPAETIPKPAARKPPITKKEEGKQGIESGGETESGKRREWKGQTKDPKDAQAPVSSAQSTTTNTDPFEGSILAGKQRIHVLISEGGAPKRKAPLNIRPPLPRNPNPVRIQGPHPDHTVQAPETKRKTSAHAALRGQLERVEQVIKKVGASQEEFDLWAQMNDINVGIKDGSHMISKRDADDFEDYFLGSKQLISFFGAKRWLEKKRIIVTNKELSELISEMGINTLLVGQLRCIRLEDMDRIGQRINEKWPALQLLERGMSGLSAGIR